MFGKLLVRRDLKKILAEIPDARTTLQATPKGELGALNRTLGRHIRNGFRDGKYAALQAFCHRQFGKDYAQCHHISFDAFSAIAIERMWELVQKEG